MANIGYSVRTGFISNEDGFSMIEALVGIVILGLILTLTSAFVKGIFSHPKALLKGEALMLAGQEIDCSARNRMFTDTVYSNPSGNLAITRTATALDSLEKINVTVRYKSTNEEVVSLTSYVAK